LGLGSDQAPVLSNSSSVKSYNTTFSDFLFAQQSTCHSKFFHSSVYCLFTQHVTGNIFAKVVQMNTLLS
jgi:hypothetical protein